MRERELYLPTVKRAAAAAAAPAASAAARPPAQPGSCVSRPAGTRRPPTRPARPSPGKPAGRGFAPGGRGISGVPGGGSREPEGRGRRVFMCPA